MLVSNSFTLAVVSEMALLSAVKILAIFSWIPYGMMAAENISSLELPRSITLGTVLSETSLLEATSTGHMSATSTVVVPTMDLLNTSHSAESRRTARINDLKVDCEEDHMKIELRFDQPFAGVVYSKGHFRKPGCVWIPSHGTESSYKFDIRFDSCGTVGQTAADGTKMYHENVLKYHENVLVVQNDPSFQEASDGLRRIRCDWKKRFDKNLIFQPFSVNEADMEYMEYSGEKIETRMEIGVGDSPFGFSVPQLPVKIGDQLTLTVKIFSKQPAEFDVVVRNCIAHDGDQNNAVTLTDASGCAVRTEIFGTWKNTRDTKDSGALVAAYVPFRAFKFPDSGQVVFQCDLSICRDSCEIHCSQLTQERGSRLKRTLNNPEATHNVSLRSVLKVAGPSWEDEIDPGRTPCRSSSSTEEPHLMVLPVAIGFSVFIVLTAIVILTMACKLQNLRRRLRKNTSTHDGMIWFEGTRMRD